MGCVTVRKIDAMQCNAVLMTDFNSFRLKFSCIKSLIYNLQPKYTPTKLLKTFYIKKFVTLWTEVKNRTNPCEKALGDSGEKELPDCNRK